jgi:hypothetical protein
MATSDGRSVGRPPHLHIKGMYPEPGDEIAGEWTIERLLRMNERFVERLERAFARGLERRPNQADQQLRRTTPVNGGDTICAHCGDPFTPFRSDMKYCSQRCRQAAYHARLASTM